MLTKLHYSAALAGAKLSAIGSVGCADLALIEEEQLPELEVHDVQIIDGAIDGMLLNHTGRRLENINLHVTYEWRGRDKLTPGVSRPAWSTSVDLLVKLAPGESYKFHFTVDHALPARSDGRFFPAVSVMSYLDYPAAPIEYSAVGFNERKLSPAV